jgi:hypothetical protein
MRREIPDNLTSFRRSWWWCHAVLLGFYFFFAAILIVLPITVSSGLITDGFTNKILIVTIAIVAGMQALFRCDRRADRYHAAWRILSYAAIKFENEENYPLSEVNDAYHRAEQLIESAFAPEEPKHHETEPSPQSN